MNLYDSYSQKIKKINEKIINIYNCGPTVYNHIHIGNARPLIVFDVLIRYLEFINIKVHYVHNITDIDDKIIVAAQKENISETKVALYYYDQYLLVKKHLNTLEMENPKVTENIDGIIHYIERLIISGSAYVINGSVYLNTALIKNYGQLGKRILKEQSSGLRVKQLGEKQNLTDFVLWKKTSEGIQWKSPWSLGRPGWHTECSFLIEKYFKNNLTIHGGGIDLKFPHHENENAQHQALYNEHLAKVWMHVGHVNIDEVKMSKSLGNFKLVKDLLKTYSYQSLRWFFYSSNYANPLNYTNDNLIQAKHDISKIEKVLNLGRFKLSYLFYFQPNKELIDLRFLAELDNNLNIVNAITIIWTQVKKINAAIKIKDYVLINKYWNEINNELAILGIEFENKFNPEVLLMINEYHNLLENKNYQKSDFLRAQLIEIGIL